MKKNKLLRMGVSLEEGWETTQLVTALITWKEARRFVVSRVLKDEKDKNNYLFWKVKRKIIFSLSPII